MGRLIAANDFGCAWLCAARSLLQCDGECFNLVLEIENPISQHAGIRQLLDEFLEARGMKPVEEVANTIFPDSLYFPSMGREHLYQNYETAWPLIRLFPANRSGTYFQRMIQWGNGDNPVNQLEATIYKLHEAKLWGKPYRSRYEVSIYQPETDGRNLMGFPCLSHLSFKLDGNRLHLTALYRNQRYIERAYGNLIGLGRLLDFVARESEVTRGKLTCLATHAELENVSGGQKAVRNLISSCLAIPGICPNQCNYG